MNCILAKFPTCFRPGLLQLFLARDGGLLGSAQETTQLWAFGLAGRGVLDKLYRDPGSCPQCWDLTWTKFHDGPGMTQCWGYWSSDNKGDWERQVSLQLGLCPPEVVVLWIKCYWLKWSAVFFGSVATGSKKPGKFRSSFCYFLPWRIRSNLLG